MPALNTANLLAFSLQVAALVAIGAGLPLALRLRSPRARLAYWRTLLLACLALPLVQPLLPPEAAPMASAASTSLTAGAGLAAQAGEPVPDAEASAALQPLLAALGGQWSIERIALTVIALGIIGRLAWLGIGLMSLGRMRRQAVPLDPRPPSVEDAALLTGAHAEFRMTPRVARPVTFGAARPVVLVPDAFGALGADQQLAVACHELVHVRRHDWLRTLADEVVRSVFWFHPALWWLFDQIHLALEQVVDQEVVDVTAARQPYLDALLRLAALGPQAALRPASMFIRRSHLRERVALLLKEVSMSRPRLVATFLTMAVVLVVSGRLVVSAFPLHGTAATPAPAAQAIQATDSAPAAVPVAQAQSTQAPRGSTRPGEATVPPPPPPPPPSSVPALIKRVNPVFPEGAPEDVSGVVVLSHTVDAAGAVTDVKVVKGESPFAEAATDAVREWRYDPPKNAPWVTVVALNVLPPSRTAVGAAPVRVGGTIKAPAKIRDVKPVYPAEARDARVQGVVIVEARVSGTGDVTEARVLRSISMLNAAALEAVCQWRFTPTLLNGKPVPVIMTVTVNFTLDGGESTTGVAGGVVGGVPGGVVAPPGAVRIGGNIAAPKKIKDVPPVYPEVALAAKVQGVVIVEVVVGADGTVQDAKILRSIPLLDQAALEAVRQWEFTPTLLNGRAVPVVMTLTVNFTLQ